MDKNKLRAKWSKRDNDFMIYYPNSRDGHLLYSWLNPPRGFEQKSFLQELVDRGYDITTFKFEIKKLPEKE